MEMKEMSNRLPRGQGKSRKRGGGVSMEEKELNVKLKREKNTILLRNSFLHLCYISLTFFPDPSTASIVEGGFFFLFCIIIVIGVAVVNIIILIKPQQQ